VIVLRSVRALVRIGLGSTIIEICAALAIDGGWLEALALDEMMLSNGDPLKGMIESLIVRPAAINRPRLTPESR
jgi:hypothetical protein